MSRMQIGVEEYQRATLSRDIAKVHKKLFGKGPEGISVSFRQNFVVIKAEGVLTQLEKNLLKAEKGEQFILEIRQILFSKFKHHVIKDINENLGSSFSDIMVDLFVSSDELIIVFC